MVPTIASPGSSFAGAAAYYLHDKDADTRERVAWTHTENLLTDDPEQAWRVMAWTARHQADIKAAAGVRAGGRKLTKPVYAVSLSWHPEQRPDQAHMLATAKRAVAAIGLGDHQAIYVCHNDEPQPHVHVVVNRVHPETGRAAAMGNDARKLQAWALTYQREHGESYCPAREANARRRALPKAERAKEPPAAESAVASAWRRSDDGRSFQAALKAAGLTLAQGNRRLVVIDRYGKATNPTRELPDVRAAAFKARLADLDLATLPTAAAAQKAARADERRRYHAARSHDRWAADYLNKHQAAHIEERQASHARYLKELDDRKSELARFYKTAELQKAVAGLRGRTERAGLLRRATGAAGKDRAALAAAERQLDDVRRRTAEQLDGITVRWNQTSTNMVERHAREDARAREYVAERRPAEYVEERAVESTRGGRAADRGRNDDGGRGREMYRVPAAPAFTV